MIPSLHIRLKIEMRGIIAPPRARHRCITNFSPLSVSRARTRLGLVMLSAVLDAGRRRPRPEEKDGVCGLWDLHSKRVQNRDGFIQDMLSAGSRSVSRSAACGCGIYL